jgi:hypothetical protein
MSNRRKKPRSRKSTPQPPPELLVLKKPTPQHADVKQVNKDEPNFSANDPKKSKIKPEWLMVALTAILVLTTIAYAIVSFAQWKVTRDTLKLGQRPWVGVKSEGTSINFSPEGAADAVITAANTGQTPAFGLISQAQIDFADTPIHELPKVQTPAEQSKGSLPPSTPISVAAHGKINGRLGYIHGVLKYSDVFGDLHTTTFCMYVDRQSIHSAGKGFAITCPIGNYMD